MPTCRVCRHLDESVPLLEGVALQEILQVGASGCITCDLLGRAVLALKDDDSPKQDLIVGWTTMRLEGLRIVVGLQDTFAFGIDLFTSKGHSTPWSLPKTGETPTEISGNTGSDAALSTAANWVSNCVETHSCRSVGSNPLPSRVLDIRNTQRVFLYCPTKQIVGEYACLSHCWGNHQPLRTTTSNINQHQDGIPLEDMPQTFQDAIKFVSGLGIAYLWVDSLCIIQDSESDWQSEAAKMSNIYANSKVTIAASLASNDSYGLFVDAPKTHRSIRIDTVDVENRPLTMHARKTLTHGHGLSPLPLMGRAWVLQERLLSPRIVHFTPEELVWECMERTTCECGCIRFLWSPGHEPFEKDLLHEQVLARASRTELRDKWHKLVEEYSRLCLTLERDRLPAVSGAARRFSSFVGGEYVVGMWRNSLVKDLMWERKVAATKPARLASIPTWSWASVNGPVVYDSAMATRDLAVVVDATSRLLKEGDEFGEVCGGSISLSGYISHVSIAQELPGEYFILTIEAGDTELLSSAEFIPDIDTSEDGGVFVCVKLGIQEGVYRTEVDQAVWLVLCCVDEAEQTYRRVGLLKTEVEAMEGLDTTKLVTVI